MDEDEKATPAEGVNPAPETENNTPAPEAENPEDQPKAETDIGDPEAVKPGDGEKEDDAKKQKRNSAKERISQLTQQRNEARARAAAAEARAAALLRQQRPPSEDASVEEFDEYRFRRAVRAENADLARGEAASAQREAASVRLAAFQAKAEAVSERMPGLVEKFCSLPAVSEEMADFVVDSEKGAEVAFYLASNPAEATQIARLPQYRQGLELARLEARLTAAPTVRKTSNAPPPPKTLKGGTNATAKDPADMTEEEYSKWYRERQKQRS